MKAKTIVSVYFVVLILEMAGEVIFDLKGLPYGIWTFKPLLMPLLMFWYYKETKAKFTFDKILLASLFFSWWGDNFLMPEIFKTDINFLLGLGSFLIAHLLYIKVFSMTPKNESYIKKNWFIPLIFLAYGLSLILFLFQSDVPGFKEMSIPVIIYATIIMLMVVTAINRKFNVNTKSYQWVLIGALLFMVSDTLIALSRFTYLFENAQFIARLLIMPLYVIGQYYIVRGALAQHAK